MNMPARDLIEAIADRVPADKRGDVVAFLEVTAGRVIDPHLSYAERRDLGRSVERGKALVEKLVRAEGLTRRTLLRETGLDF